MTTKVGIPVCGDCKRTKRIARKRRERGAPPVGTCWTCRRPGVVTIGRRICEGCRQRGVAVQRECKTCGQLFTTKIQETECSSCQHHKAKHPCTDCGVLVDRRATRCRACQGVNARDPGARRHSRAGYVMVKHPDHPAADKQGYVREHRLVMEERLGRFLLPGENVHHRNGVRDDNRPKNLELWVSTQPSGQRVDDLVAWAREILDRYG